jgi:hypothetical protein
LAQGSIDIARELTMIEFEIFKVRSPNELVMMKLN